MIKIRNKGLTLLELIISMGIFSLIMISLLSSVQSMMVARVKTMNRIALMEQLYTFQEILFTEIKDGGTLDYEEYWNRLALGYKDTSPNYGSYTGSGHYVHPTGVGNFGAHLGKNPSSANHCDNLLNNDCRTNKDGDTSKKYYGEGLYYCRSTRSIFLTNKGCILGVTSGDARDNFASLASGDLFYGTSGTRRHRNHPQRSRYGQYALQFWDFNGNANNDKGDEDRNGSIVGDEDDVNLWDGPNAIPSNDPKAQELYLIDKQKNVRTFFRWNITNDPELLKKGESCDLSRWTGGTIPDNCLGNIQMLRLTGHDVGINHDGQGETAYDGKIDTWVCADGWECSGEALGVLGGKKIATGTGSEWINIFPNSVNVRNIRFEVYPKKDPWLAASADDCDSSNPSCISPFIHPYARFSLELGFSHGKRRTIRGDNPIISIATTVTLDDFH